MNANSGTIQNPPIQHVGFKKKCTYICQQFCHHNTIRNPALQILALVLVSFPRSFRGFLLFCQLLFLVFLLSKHNFLRLLLLNLVMVFEDLSSLWCLKPDSLFQNNCVLPDPCMVTPADFISILCDTFMQVCTDRRILWSKNSGESYKVETLVNYYYIL